MNTIGKAIVNRNFSIVVFLLLLTANVGADFSDSVVLLQYSNLKCGARVSNNVVKLIDLQGLVHDKMKAVSQVEWQVPDHGLESPVPLLMEKAHVERKPRRKALLRDVIREAASRGCDLAIVLDIEVVDKVMFRPELMDLKLKVGYVLVLFGSQVKNSARR